MEPFEPSAGLPGAGDARPSALARAMAEYLGCRCAWFAPGEDDAPLLDAYCRAREEGARAGFVPVLAKVERTLWQTLVWNACRTLPDEGCLEFDPRRVEAYRRAALAAPLRDGRALLDERIGRRRANALARGEDWKRDVLGGMAGGQASDSSEVLRDPFTAKTCPVLLAQVPTTRPWEVFAWLPFGGWNSCPDVPELMAVAKYWYERYGAVPAVITRDALEFDLPAPVPATDAMEAALEHYAFCFDVDRGSEWRVGALADSLRRSTVWHFWWD